MLPPLTAYFRCNVGDVGGGDVVSFKPRFVIPDIILSVNRIYKYSV